MARVGPNQDINNPIDWIDIAYRLQVKSRAMGNHYAVSASQDPNVAGSPIVNVSVPLAMTDGSTYSFPSSDISFVGGQYVYDTNTIGNANILTYVNLAERFRGYWTSINAIIDTLSPFEYLIEEPIDPIPETTGYLPSVGTINHGSLGGTSYSEKAYGFTPSSSNPIPEWTGEGPTDYNSSTYPQLSGAIDSLNVVMGVTDSNDWDTIYYYSKTTDILGSTRGAQATMGRIWPYGGLSEYIWIQIYNHESESVDVPISVSVSAYFDQAATLGGLSVAEIREINDYPTGNPTLYPSFQQDSDSIPAGGGSASASHVRTVSIPAEKSAFIYARGSANSNFTPSGMSINMSVAVNGYTITHSASI